MKNILFLSFLFSVLFASAQDKISFTYDTAGNQTKRELVCVTCPPLVGKKAKAIEEITHEDLIKSDVSDQISYYPNPVAQELYLKWELVNDKTVSAIQVYSISGQILQNYPTARDAENAVIGFQNYPQGYYLLTLSYDNGEQKTIKIVKQ